MINKFVLTVGLCLWCNFGYSQQSYCDEFEIQKIALSDSFLINQIEKLINELEDNDSLFMRGFGYIELYDLIPLDSGAIRGYQFFPWGTSLGKGNKTYPPFYTIIHNRPVLIYFGNFETAVCKNFSKKSKKKLRSVVEPFLFKTIKIKSKDENGNIIIRDKNFREEFFYHGIGKVLVYFRDKPPIARDITDYD